jgi:3'-5' exoribonuclease
MKEQYAAELESGMRVDSVFAIRAREVRLARTGAPYLWMELADRTGSLEAVRFRIAPDDAAIPVGSVARVRGSVTTWRGARSVRVSALAPAEAVDRGDLMPTTAQDPVALGRRLNDALSSISDRALRQLVRTVFTEPGFAARFADSPASESGHHACLGGLLEHTVAVADSCDRLASGYPSADRDLLVAAALLHDVGAVDALEFDTAIAVSDRGRLSGHVELGLERLRRAATSMGAFAGTRRFAEVAHAVAAHHLDPGAESGPATLEALLLSTADLLDVRATLLVGETARAARDGAAWSDGAAFGRPMLVPPSGPAFAGGPTMHPPVPSGPGCGSRPRGGYLRAAG